MSDTIKLVDLIVDGKMTERGRQIHDRLHALLAPSGKCAAVVGGPLESQRAKPFTASNAFTPPPHGATGKGRIYIRADSQDWPLYAENYRAAHGEYPRPNPYGGRWFNIAGETALTLSSEPTTPEGIHDGALSLDGKRDHPTDGDVK